MWANYYLPEKFSAKVSSGADYFAGMTPVRLIDERITFLRFRVQLLCIYDA